MLEVLQVISLILQTISVVLLASLVHIGYTQQRYVAPPPKEFDYGRKERQPNPTNYNEATNQPKASPKIQVPELDPSVIAKSLKKPPRPPGGFGSVVSDKDGQCDESGNSK